MKTAVPSPPRRARRACRQFPPARGSGRLLVRLGASDVGLFRFLLEAYDNLAGFTVLDRREALLKVFFSPHQAGEARAALADIGASVPLTVLPWPGGEAAAGGPFMRPTLRPGAFQ